MTLTLKRIRTMPIVALVVCAFALSLAGCERKEKVIDIKAPGVDIEVNKTKRGVEVEADRDVDIKAPGVDVEVKKDNK